MNLSGGDSLITSASVLARGGQRMGLRHAWVWTVVGLAVGLLVGYDGSSPLDAPRFDWGLVILIAMVGMLLSVVAGVWPQVRAPPLQPCPSCSRPRHPEAVLCPYCGHAR